MKSDGAGGVRNSFAIFLLGLTVTSSLAAPPIGQVDVDGPAKMAPASTWASYNGGYDGQRFSDLTEISTENAANLQEVCRVKAGELGAFVTGPVLVNGLLYITTGRATIALNPANCEIVWKSPYRPRREEGYAANRGVAYLDGKVFRGLPDGTIAAYDADTGQEIWRTDAIDPSTGGFPGSAPLAWNGMVFIGIAGGDMGLRGKMFAFDAATGKKLWQFNLVPQAGDAGVETWKGRSYETGGGGTWSSYALDPETGELFIPVANPAPDLDKGPRVGGKQHTNLYTNSVVVLDAVTGKLKWYYQTRPADDHDYGVTPPPMLFTGAGGRKLVALGSKDGHVYVIDRETHRLVFKQPVVKLHNFLKSATPEGTTICPGALGGIEWNGVAHDRLNHALVVGAVDWCHKIFLAPQAYVPGKVYYSGRMEGDGSAPNGTITSLDSKNGKIRWQFKPGAPVVAGITPTAGGVTFAGDLAGNFYTLRSSNGEILRKIATGGALAGGIVTYSVSGKQYVTLTSGNISRSTFGASGTPTLIIYSLSASPAAANSTPSTPAPAPASAPSTPAVAGGDAASGGARYTEVCSGCHGSAGEGASGPRLRGIADRASYAQTVEWIRNPKSAAMPKFYPDMLSAADVDNVAAYIRTLK